MIDQQQTLWDLEAAGDFRRAIHAATAAVRAAQAKEVEANLAWKDQRRLTREAQAALQDLIEADRKGPGPLFERRGEAVPVNGDAPEEAPAPPKRHKAGSANYPTVKQAQREVERSREIAPMVEDMQRLADEADAEAEGAPAKKRGKKAGPSTSPEKPLPLRGEPIGPLGISAEQLRAASLVGLFDLGISGKPLTKPVTVKPVMINLRPHVLLDDSENEAGKTWIVRPLYAVDLWPATYPDLPACLEPDFFKVADPYAGVRLTVKFGRVDREYVVGTAGEARQLIQPKEEAS